MIGHLSVASQSLALVQPHLGWLHFPAPPRADSSQNAQARQDSSRRRNATSSTVANPAIAQRSIAPPKLPTISEMVGGSGCGIGGGNVSCFDSTSPDGPRSVMELTRAMAANQAATTLAMLANS